MQQVKPEDITSKDYYFDSYAHFGIHEQMIKDSVRTGSYQEAIERNRKVFEGKVVLDVGCGTGILSMFAVRAGAKHVYAVDCSSIFYMAKEIVELNKFQDKITLIHGMIEKIELPVKVDIIISEWMGYALLYESMLDSVLYARDKWLAPNGLILPDRAVLWICGIEDKEYKSQKINFWKDVYGFNMKCIQSSVLQEPLVDVVNPDCISSSLQLRSFDLYTVKKEDLSFESPFRLNVTRNDYLTAFVVYFDIGFTSLDFPVWFSTSPRAVSTHWRQSVFYLSEELVVSRNETVTGSLSVRPNARNHRDLDFSISFQHKGKINGLVSAVDSYRMR
ncbi:hypothetical protein GUITHDRAFT_158580 [Guillardia theta CCMP2712]|uniref:Protein arginine N-methyltransferase domain-containing protein n=1 Tax=Guillardia theta (strain CCMP2712) TaxID=905079 RepID=L1IMY9_GUITC|nr:hypothetical protein GUITHDRAFT_158580 [Guillardia theta CCMP2712]EKX37628.1 hypothetical protein GUITHDRAFT_158580 [Guillardia theta CCMP2712]|eukprot:XP_005824608.1 hypothetical protein GUITHDRAFT_158580 [Guillardia theta CCMP2712]